MGRHGDCSTAEERHCFGNFYAEGMVEVERSKIESILCIIYSIMSFFFIKNIYLRVERTFFINVFFSLNYYYF